MRTYSVTVAWDHKGARYPMQQSVRVKATSVSAAIGKGLRQVRSKHRGSLREVLGSVIDIKVTVLNEVQTEKTEVENVGRTDDAKDEPEGGDGVAEV